MKQIGANSPYINLLRGWRGFGGGGGTGLWLQHDSFGWGNSVPWQHVSLGRGNSVPWHADNMSAWVREILSHDTLTTCEFCSGKILSHDTDYPLTLLGARIEQTVFTLWLLALITTESSLSLANEHAAVTDAAPPLDIILSLKSSDFCR